MELITKHLEIIKKTHDLLMKAKKVSIFVHVHPDFDALGSASAVKSYLISKGIDAKIIGTESIIDNNSNEIFRLDTTTVVGDDFISNSVGLILDTANAARVLTQKHLLCKNTIRFDHHPFIETIAKHEWVDEQISSTSEMVGWWIFFNNKEVLTHEICNFLYAGILTDTGNLMQLNTTSSTYDLVRKFYDYDFDKQFIQDKIYLQNLKKLQVEGKILQNIKVTKNNVGYFIFTKKFINKNNLINLNNKTYLLSKIDNVDIWATFYFDKDTNGWKASLRSRKYQVNNVAKKYNGGGHKFAAGCKLNDKKEIKFLLDDLDSIISFQE